MRIVSDFADKGNVGPKPSSGHRLICPLATRNIDVVATEQRLTRDRHMLHLEN